MTTESNEKRKPMAFSLYPADLAALDDWRRRQADLPNRSEALRRIINQIKETEL